MKVALEKSIWPLRQWAFSNAAIRPCVCLACLSCSPSSKWCILRLWFYGHYKTLAGNPILEVDLLISVAADVAETGGET